MLAELVAGEVADYQMAAFLMAIFFRGLDDAETVALTEAMLALATVRCGGGDSDEASGATGGPPPPDAGADADAGGGGCGGRVGWSGRRTPEARLRQQSAPEGPPGASVRGREAEG